MPDERRGGRGGTASCATPHEPAQGGILLAIAAIVFVLWILGLIFFKAAKGFIHILLLIGIVLLLFHFFGKA